MATQTVLYAAVADSSGIATFSYEYDDVTLALTGLSVSNGMTRRVKLESEDTILQEKDGSEVLAGGELSRSPSRAGYFVIETRGIVDVPDQLKLSARTL